MATATEADSRERLDFQRRYLLDPMIAFRVRLFLAGIIFPPACFIATAYISPTMAAPWQSGQAADYVAMLLTWPGYAPFLPLVALSQACMALWLVFPALKQRMIIRLGIYSGLVISLQFLLFVLMTSMQVTIFAAAFVGPILALVVAACVRIPRLSRQFAIRHLLILTTVVALLIAIAQLVGIPLQAGLPVLLGSMMCILIATPTLCALAYTRATIAVATQEPADGGYSLLTAALTWIFGWAAAWKSAVDIMLVEYSQLPTTDPNCYVSTAAARGHRAFVGTHACPAGVRPVNLQVRRLKFLEIVLKAGWPGIHRYLRSIYDHVGPGLAKQCRRSVWFADATYLMLKPVEWAGEVTRMTLSVPVSSIQQLYGAPSGDQSIA